MPYKLNMETNMEYSDLDLERIAGAFLLHRTLGLQLTTQGYSCLLLCRESTEFCKRFKAILKKLSKPNDFGIQKMTQNHVSSILELIADE